MVCIEISRTCQRLLVHVYISLNRVLKSESHRQCCAVPWSQSSAQGSWSCTTQSTTKRTSTHSIQPTKSTRRCVICCSFRAFRASYCERHTLNMILEREDIKRATQAWYT